MIILTAVVIAAGALLVWAGLDHVRTPGLVSVPQAGPGVRRLLAVAFGVAEMATGVAAITVLVAPWPVGRLVLVAQGLLFLGFLGYLLPRYLRHDRGDCGCSRLATRIGMAGLLRAGALGLASLGAAVGYPAVTLPSVAATGAHLGLLAAAGGALCLLLHALPSAVDGLSRHIGTRRYA